jgi:hypothetical protein
MVHRRYFLLQESVPATEVGNFLCRVVVSKTLPLARFAPFSLPGTPAYNSNDIIPSILPEAFLSTIDEQSLSTVRERRISLQLSALLGLSATRSETETRTLKSRCLRRYSLPNPDVYFQELMRNESYARDVRALLDETWPRHAYLVTGFLTATDSSWSAKTNQGTTRGFNITIPISEIVSTPLPVPGLADVGIAPEWSTSTEQSSQTRVSGEEIFAVSYSVVKLSYKFTRSGGFVTSFAAVGRPKRAKAHHLALGHDEYDESDEEDNSNTGTHRPPVAISEDTGVVELDGETSLLNVAAGELWIDVP